MAFIPCVSGPDQALLDAFRKQVRSGMERGGSDGAWAVLLMWDGQPDVARDDLIDVVKEELGLIPPGASEAAPPPRGAVQRSPFA